MRGEVDLSADDGQMQIHVHMHVHMHVLALVRTIWLKLRRSTATIGVPSAATHAPSVESVPSRHLRLALMAFASCRPCVELSHVSYRVRKSAT